MTTSTTLRSRRTRRPTWRIRPLPLTRCSSTRRSARCADSRRTCRPRSWASRLPANRVARLRRLGTRSPRPAASRSARRRWRPSKRDRRFADDGWTEQPAAAAAGSGLSGRRSRPSDELVADADLDWRDDQRTRFLTENLVEAVAPSNVPLVNPASAKAADRQRRANLVRGGDQLRARPRLGAPRIPEMVDRSASKWAATSPRRRGGRAAHRCVRADPVRAADRAGARGAAAARAADDQQVLRARPGARTAAWSSSSSGRASRCFVMSWRNPDARHAAWDFDTYVQAILDALDAVERITGTDRTALAGICSGGILASIAAAYLAATGRQDRLAAFAPAVTVIDNARAGTGVGARPTGGWPPPPRRSPRAAATSTAGHWPRCSRGCGPATWSGTTGSTTTCSARSRRRSTSCSGTPTPPG